MITQIFTCFVLTQLTLLILSSNFSETSAKTFSINEALKQGFDLESKPTSSTSHRTKDIETTSNIRLSKKPRSTRKTKPSVDIVDGLFSQKLSSPLKQRKHYQIKTPVKPKRIRDLLSLRDKRKSRARKRETINNEDINQKYIPLLKNLGMLINNLLASGSSELSEEDGYRRESIDIDTTRNTDACRCDPKPSNIYESEKDKTAVTTTTDTSEIVEIPTEIQAAPSSIHYTAISDISNHRQNKKLPILPSRNTTSSGRNYTRHGERDRASLYGSIEGDNTRHNGNNEHNTEQGVDSGTESDEEDSYSFTRNDAISGGTSGLHGNRIFDGNPENRQETEATTNEPNETEENIKQAGRDNLEFEREIEHKTEGDKTENSRPVPVYVRGETVELTTHKILYNSETYEESQEGWKDISKSVTSNKRVVNGSGSVTSENKAFYKPNQGMIPSDIANIPIVLHNNWNNNNTLVTIYDGYSVASGKNGKQKLAEESIFIYP